MKRSERCIRNTFKLSAFTIVLALFAALGGNAHGQKATGPQQVKVVNTAAESVPVTLAPDATVGISGTPTVNVNSSQANPLIVRNADNPTRVPFQVRFGANVMDGVGAIIQDLFTVPEGKRAVIEFASGLNKVPVGQTVLDFLIETRLNGDDVDAGHRFIVQSIPGTTPATFVVSGTAKLYADPGTIVKLRVIRTNGTAGLFSTSVTVSGYLEDVSQPPQQQQ